MKKNLFFVIAIFLLCSSFAIAKAPMRINFQAKLATSEGLLQNTARNIRIGFYDGEKINDTDPKNDQPKWREDHIGIWFNAQGIGNIIIGEVENLTLEEWENNIMKLEDPYIGITILGSNGSSIGPAYVPFPSAPFAIQAKIAEEVLEIDAANISGSFIVPVVVDNDLIVTNNALVVNSQTQKVGIGVSQPKYSLDVNGSINADGFKINGKDLESQLSWTSEGDSIYYLKGFVGIGTSAPTVNLDIVGTINATEYLQNGKPLTEVLGNSLLWKKKDTEFTVNDVTYRSIYYDYKDGSSQEGFVGIGTTDPLAKLDVNGAIRIGAFLGLRGSPQPGTISFDENDFKGYTSSGWKSLTGISGEGEEGQLVFWKSTDTISGSPTLVWDSTKNNLGIGSATPDATLELRATNNTDLLKITSADDQDILYVGYNDQSNTYNVGIGTTTPTEKLVVNGIINAAGFTINGRPIDETIKVSPVWSQWEEENNGRIFYIKGNVGIGTEEPRNLLELASRNPSANPALTFDIYGEDLFTVGMDYANPDEFLISKGGDLSQPVFVFKGQQIGIGLQSPEANLHVSGNTGVIFEGTFLEDDQITEDDKFKASGPGTKLIWYPAKAVFRAGFVNSTQWNEYNLGDYSVAMGYNPIASGNYSFVGGGKDNIASAEGAVVPGGLSNQALGKYSFAAGYYAKANHAATFVWSDLTSYTTDPDQEYFASQYPNQFIIRANNGVGIGTTDTKGSVLTIARNTYKELLFKAIDNQGKPAMVISTSGNVGIGTDNPGDARLAVMDGKVGIGTTAPSASLTVVNQENNQIIFIAKSASSPTAGILVNSNGQVGIGVTAGYVFDPSTRLKVNGDIKGSQFKVVDPDDPNGEIILQPNPGSPWADPSDNDNNTHRSQGMVGIGTPSPNSLLELSNRNEKGSLPVITFDVDGVDTFSMGPTLNAGGNDYLFTIQAGGDLSSLPPISISSTNVGIGTFLQTPQETLHVAGRSIFDGQVLVGTTNASTDLYSLIVNGAINVEQLFIKGALFTPKETPWKTLGLNIYYTSGNVGIGTSVPSEKLEVVGTIQTNGLNLTNSLRLDDGAYLTTEKLELRDADPNVPTPGLLYVDNNSLLWQGPDDTSTKKLSSPLQRGEGTEGNLAFWVDDTSLGESTILWKEADRQLTISGNLIVSKNFTTETGFIITSNINMGAPTALSIGANLSYIGNPYSVRSFTGEKIYIGIDKTWGHPDERVQIKGLQINMESKDSSYLYQGAEAIGLYIDMSDVNLDTGNKYAAIFKGGNVGIGLDSPRAALEVAGTVSANFFNLSGGLTVPQLVINDGAMIAIAADSTLSGTNYIPRVAINFEFDGDWDSLTKEERQIALTNQLANTDAELIVNGTISANMIDISGGLTATTLNVQQGALVVDTSGNIGIGTEQPDGQIEISKVINNQDDIETNFYSQKIFINVDGAGDPDSGLQFTLNKNLTGLDINMQSEENNSIAGNVTGLNLDLSEINLQTLSSVTGLKVNVEDTLGSGGTRYAAIFNGGYVGIGTPTPQAELDVSGNILAKNLTLDGTLAAETAEFNLLTINESASLNGTVTINNNLIVMGTATINHLVLNNTLESAEGNFETINATIASINQLLKTNVLDATTVNADIAYFDKVGIGRATTEDHTLAVSGNILASNITVTDIFSLSSSTLNVNNGNLFISPYSSKVGIGTTEPDSALHIYTTDTEFSTVFRPEDNRTWNGIRIQTQGTNAELAAGILLVPDSSAPSRSIGSGIIAVRSSSETDAGSHLVFVTDPDNDVPAERMRLSSEGYLGIGTNSPQYQLEVNGTTRFDGTVTVNGSIVASTITGVNGVTINPNGQLIVTGMTKFTSDVEIDNGLYFKQDQEITGTSNYGILFSGSSDPDDHSLYYMEPNSSTPINISAPFVGQPNRIPYFNPGGSLEDDANIFWDGNNQTFKIGTGNANASLEIVTTINNTMQGNVALHKILMNFDDRSALPGTSAGLFTGLDISFASEKTASPIEFGRLANGETAIGLKVDMRNLRTKHFLGESLQQGTKYAALFMGGGVGIGTTLPQAALHVASEEFGHTPLRIDTRDETGAYLNALIVSANGNIGIGTSDPQSRLTVKTAAASESPFAIIDSSGTNPILYINPNNNNIGIGTLTPQTDLDVNGTISAETTYFSSVKGTTMNIGNGAFFVNASGNIGIGTTTPSGNIAFHKEILQSTPIDGNEYISHKVEIELSGGQESSPFRFQRNLTGMDIDLSSDALTRLGNSATSYNATGVRIDMSDLLLDENNNASAVGLFVDLTNNNPAQETGGTRYAAIFDGGYVGIGTATPSVELEVSGNIQAKGLFLSGKLEAYDATFNSISVTGVASFNNAVTINNRLYANTVSANNIILSGTLYASTGSVTLLEADTASFNRVGIGLFQPPSVELEVSGNALFHGDTTISGVLSVSTINSTTGITINLPVDSKIYVDGSLDVNKDLLVGRGLYLKKTTPNTGSTLAQLYVNDDGELRYLLPNNGGNANLSALYGTVSKIPFYDFNGNNRGNLSDTAHLSWSDNTITFPDLSETTIKEFKIGTENALTSMKLLSNINQKVTGDVAAHNINMLFDNRTIPGEATIFSGLKIKLSSLIPEVNPENDFGRIAENETAIGLKVDVSNLAARYQSQLAGNPTYKGYKYAGLFLGGNVGIGTTSPEAALHVASEIPDTMAFSVDTLQANALTVSSNSFVGIGTSTPVAQLTIKPYSSNAQMSALEIVKQDNSGSIFSVKNDGKIGVGTNVPSANLHIIGDLSPFSAGTTAYPNALVVTADGLVGIGNSDPSALLHTFLASGYPDSVPAMQVGIEEVEDNAFVVAYDGKTGIGMNNPPYRLSVDGIILSGTDNITGIPSWLSSNDNDNKGYLISTGEKHSFFGLKQNADNNYDTVIHWGTTETDALHFEHFTKAYEIFPDFIRKVMTLKGDGRVGIGTISPSANLTVSGNFQVNLEDTIALMVSSNGWVGVNTDTPRTNLDVNGDFMTNSLTVTQGKVEVSTLDLKGTLQVYKSAKETDIKSIGQIIDLSISSDVQVPITGLDITLKSERFAADNRGYALWGDGIAYGLKVDVNDLTVGAADLNNSFAHKYAGVFLGGYVGIGTQVPRAALHVQSPSESDIAKFGTINGNVTLHDFGAGIVGFYNIDADNDTTYHHTLTLAPSLSNAAGKVPGKVGIGIVAPDNTTLDKTLVVNGDMRLGIVEQSETTGEAGYGNKLWFSGAPDIDPDYDPATGAPITNENRDDIWIARYNREQDRSELHVNIGSGPEDENAADRFAVGYTPGQGAAFTRVFQVVSDGKVGIQDGAFPENDIDAFPQTTLHVRGQQSGPSSELNNHIAVLENNNSQQANTLAIYHSFNIGDDGLLPTESHFITFYAGENAQEMGSIEGNGQTGDLRGVRFKTSAADYAEYLPKLDPEEEIVVGDIVGVFNGKISKKTRNAQQIMVISSTAGVAGNFPGRNKEHLYKLVSFFGQVPVKVKGRVKVGDYIIPSGNDDGIGIPVPAKDISLSAINNILGRAWEGSKVATVKKINVAVGFAFSLPSLKEEMKTVYTLKDEINSLKTERANIVENFETKLEAQNKEIQQLIKAIKNN